MTTPQRVRTLRHRRQHAAADPTGTRPTTTSSWLLPASGVARESEAPASSFDPTRLDQPNKVHRGGSFLCTDHYCSRFIVGTQGKAEVDTGTDHLCFRCVPSAALAFQQAQSQLN